MTLEQTIEYALGQVAWWWQGDFNRAVPLFAESLREFREAGDGHGIGLGLLNVGRAAHHSHDYERAVTCFKESLAISKEAGDPWLGAAGLEGLAITASAAGDHERAARLFATVETLRETLGYHHSPIEQSQHDRYVTSTRASLGDANFAKTWATGRAMRWSRPSSTPWRR